MTSPARPALELLLCLFLALPGFAAGAEEARFLTIRDTLRLDDVGDPRLSPDGAWVLYTRSHRDIGPEVEEDEDLEQRTHVWRVRSDGTERRQMTRGEVDATSPAWHPSGERLSFLAARGAAARSVAEGGEDEPKPQVYVMEADGGEAWALTDHPEGVESYAWSPDGRHLAFLAVDPLGEEEEERRDKKDDAYVVDEDFRFTHLWLWDVEAKKARRLTRGDFTVSDLDYSPSGRHIAYVRRPTPKEDETWQSDVWIAEVESGESRLLYDNPGSDESPRFSPDGRSVAFASKPQEGSNTYHLKLRVAPLDGGPVRELLGDFDRDFTAPTWSPDGGTIYWSAGDRTSTRVFAVDLESGEAQALATPEGNSGSFELSRDGAHWVYRHTAPAWPAEIHVAAVDFATSQAVSDAHAWLREESVQLATPRTVRWENSDGEEIEGVLTLPPGATDDRRHPFLLQPHGGPSGAVTTSFGVTSQLLAAHGFAILQPNFRGSTHYGQAFENANRNQWGIRDLDDCLTGVDHAIAQGWADPERLGAYGWSYGGYLTFWLATQSDRFRAISPGAGLSNLYSMYGTTDVPGYLAWFFGTPWEEEDLYRRLSPIRHADKVTAKMLIMTGEEDERVPPEQSFEMYKALVDLGKDVELVIFPREGHGIREPRHRMDRLRRYLDFFTAALLAPSETESPTSDSRPR